MQSDGQEKWLGAGSGGGGNNRDQMKLLDNTGLFRNDTRPYIAEQAVGSAKRHSQCSSGFAKIKNSAQDVLFDYILILPWKTEVTHEMTK